MACAEVVKDLQRSVEVKTYSILDTEPDVIRGQGLLLLRLG